MNSAICNRSQDRSTIPILLFIKLSFLYHLIQLSILYVYFLVLADVGGFLGLFLGCSVLSIIEIFFFMAAALFRVIRRLLTKNKEVEESSTITENIAIGPDLKSFFERFENLELEVKRLSRNSADIESLLCLKKFFEEKDQKISKKQKIVEKLTKLTLSRTSINCIEETQKNSTKQAFEDILIVEDIN